MGIFRACQPLCNSASNCDAVFCAQIFRLNAHLRRNIWAEHDLHDPAAVPEVNKKQTAVIPKGIDPTGKQHFVADCIRGQLPAENTL
jgi:hypothetical protein